MSKRLWVPKKDKGLAGDIAAYYGCNTCHRNSRHYVEVDGHRYCQDCWHFKETGNKAKLGDTRRLVMAAFTLLDEEDN